MSKYQGGMIGSVANATSGTAYTGRANGVFPLPQQIVAKSSSLWAIGQTRPNPPTIGTATATGATTISVAFIPPVQNGGSTITSYTVTSSGGQTATGASSPIVVSGLTTGVSYTFTVTATSALGTSDSSGTSNSVTIVTDPYFSSVSLLLNGDGTNGSTTFTDLSSSPKVITAYGTTQISTTQKKFGTASLLFDGSGDYLSLSANTAFNFGTGDFTVELWIKTNIKINYQSIFISADASLWLHTDSAGNLIYGAGSGDRLTGYGQVCDDAWHHIAITRFSGTVRLFIDGVQKDTTSNTTSINLTTPITIGTYSSSRYYTGYIDDLRITKGVARYTANFTPPTAALPTL